MQTPVVKRNQSTREYYIDEGCHITEWWNTDADPAVSIARARVEPGVTTRLHSLSGTVERYVVLEGNGLVEVGGIAAQQIGHGDMVFIPAGVVQRITNNGACDLVFLAVCTPRFRSAVYRDEETGS